MQKYTYVSLGVCACLSLALLTGCNSKSPDSPSSNAQEVSSSTENKTETTSSDSKNDLSSTSETSTSSAASILYQVDTDTADLDSSHDISDHLYGIFLEDINFAVDGGMYSELVKNRSFEYGTKANNANKHGWMNSDSDVLDFEVVDGSEDSSYLNTQNPHYAVLTNSSSDYVGISNLGYLDGLAVTEGIPYHFSVYLKSDTNYSDPVHIVLRTNDGNVCAEADIDCITSEWTKYDCSLTPNATVNKNLRLYVEIKKGSICMDMVSLMTTDTYKESTVKREIGEALEALHPSFLRFPGGCVIEGKSLDSMYSWKDSIGNGMKFTINGKETIGDVAVRPQGESIWGGDATNPYYTTYGLGFYEYFVLCENLGCSPVPVLNAGMTCPIQSTKNIVFDLGSDEFKQCVQDALDLVEFCLGDDSTTWGHIRCAMGHTAPFPLKYIAIGNEQWQSEYHEHYAAFVEAFDLAKKERPELYGNIELALSNGPTSGDHYGWDLLESKPDDITTLIDEHYYESPNWFLTNTERYDQYDRSAQAKVFLGEYAAKSNTLEAALAEAAFMTGLERNGDIVGLACYAPLFGNVKVNQWSPDLIWFSNSDVIGSVNYYVQKMFSNNVGCKTLNSSLDFGSFANEESLHGLIGLGSWRTKVSYDNLKVTSNENNSLLYECNFEESGALHDDDWHVHKGNWAITNGSLIQSNTANPVDESTGDVIYVGDINWNNYTLTVDAKILGGNEGFLIPVCVEDAGNNIFWNLGGWNNTVSCLQIVSGKSKTGQINGTVRNITLKKNTSYQLKVVVSSANIKCYVNDDLYIDYDVTSAKKLYETSSVAEDGSLILKLVNVSEEDLPVSTHLEHFDDSVYNTTAAVTTLAGTDLKATNTFAKPDTLIPSETTMEIAADFTTTLPKYSVTIIRISKK